MSQKNFRREHFFRFSFSLAPISSRGVAQSIALLIPDDFFEIIKKYKLLMKFSSCEDRCLKKNDMLISWMLGGPKKGYQFFLIQKSIFFHFSREKAVKRTFFNR